ncbi:MAG: FecR domain-containing protein, partial [Bacteroidales bacterium]
ARQRKVSLEGEAFFDVTRDASQPFIIETEPAIVEVLGTSFNVRSTGENDFELYVEEGKVRVSTRKKPSERMDVEAGETLSFSENRFIKFRAGDNSASEWKTNRMHFKDETLENILMVINRNFGSRLEVVPEASQRRLTVTFYQSTLPTIIELISLSMNLQTEEKEGSVIEFKPGA